jgi:hypothetical protein
MSRIKYRWFASMDKEKQRLIAGRGGQSAHAIGKAHTWTTEEASKAGKIGRMKPRTPKTVSELMTPHSTRSRLLELLQDSLARRPDMPV